LKKLINIVLITLLITSNMFISPGFAKESTDMSEENQVILYSPESEEDLILYEDEDLEEEQDSVKNNFSALLIGEISEKETSLVEVETSEKVIQGYIDSESVIDPSEMMEEYKLYSEDENEEIPMYIDESQEELLYELEEGTSVLVNKIYLKEQRTEDYVHVTLNPETEEVPEELEEEFEKPEDVQGFVQIDHLIAPDKEEVLLSEREEKESSEENVEKQKPTNDEQSNEEEQSNSEEAQPDDKLESDDEAATGETEEEKENNEMSTFASKPQTSSTSRLGHIRGGDDRKIYKTLGGKSTQPSSKHWNKVYYIKRQAKIDSETYYLLSRSPSASKNVVGWMNAKDLETHKHQGVSRESHQMIIKGTGRATSKAWGGSKDAVHRSLSKYKNKKLHVNLTEKVGNNIWYRGKINGSGQNVWLHENQVKQIEITESETSRLGHIRGGDDRKIYKTLGGKSTQPSSKHWNKVYYIKRQAKMDSETYYLLSRSPSASKNVVGWMNAKDLETHKHQGVSRESHQMIIKGTGRATSKAWGGSKDTVHQSMKSFTGDIFDINLTEKVGKNTWYRGKINSTGQNVWLHSNKLEKNNDKLIVLDAGHGGHDGGASANGIIEKDVALDVTLRVEKMLKARGYDVLLTRRTDRFIELSERSNIANRNNADTFLSIHANSGGGIGTETWWYNRNNAVTSKLFAQTIQNAVIKTTNARDRGIKHGNLSVNRESKMTSALLEIGFLDSLTDARNLKKASYKNKIAKGVADGFDNYYK